MARLAEIIEVEDVLPQLEPADKRGIIEQLAAHIAKRHPTTTLDELIRVLWERELLSSTAIGKGVAIPHGKIAGIEKPLACLARVVGGVSFDALDGQPTHLFAVLVAPESSTGEHLKALARISRLFRSEATRQELLTAQGADRMHEVIRMAEDKAWP